jgi:type I restriction enzyme S subunit
MIGSRPLQRGWRAVTLEDIVCGDGVFVDGDWVESKDQDPAGDVRLIQLADVGDGEYRNRSERFLTSEKARELGCTLLEPGDLLVARMPDPLGRACIFPGDQKRSVTVVDVAIVRPRNPEVSTRWLMYCINAPQFRHVVASLQSGSTRQRISRKNLAKIAFPLPPLDWQDDTVASIERQFSRLDEAVANLKRVKANVKRLEASILIEAVAGRLVAATGPLWRTVQVCEVGDVLLGRQRAPQYLTGRWPRKYLRVANIKDDKIDFSDVETMDFDEGHFAKYQLSPGDILISEGQSPELLGQSAVFQGFTESLCFQKTLHRFRAHPDITTPGFAQVVFRSHVRSGVFRRLGSITTNIGHLTLEKFKGAPFPLPPLDEQYRIVAEVDRRLSIVREVEAEVDAKLKQVGVLRESVLVQAFGCRATAV